MRRYLKAEYQDSQNIPTGRYKYCSFVFFYHNHTGGFTTAEALTYGQVNNFLFFYFQKSNIWLPFRQEKSQQEGGAMGGHMGMSMGMSMGMGMGMGMVAQMAIVDQLKECCPQQER